jgi:hypothetical protein
MCVEGFRARLNFEGNTLVNPDIWFVSRNSSIRGMLIVRQSQARPCRVRSTER